MLPAFRSEVEELLAEALTTLGYSTADLGIEEPPGGVDAILASSVAFRLRDEERPPPGVAAAIVEAIDTDRLTLVGSVSAQGPYVNFAPGPRYYARTLDAAQKAGFARRPETGQSVLVEHTSANPTGPVHVGRARNPIIGDALARLLRMAGHDVTVQYYVNDAGRQLALFTWAYETLDPDDYDIDPPERDRPDYELVRYYRAGNRYLESASPDEVDAAEAEIASVLAGLDDGDPRTIERVSTIVDRVLQGMRATLDRLPATFDEWVRETRFLLRPDAGGEAPSEGFQAEAAGSWTEDVTTRLRGLDEAVYDAGAWQLDLADHGIEKNLVFERSDGTSLYATRDIAHHEWKLANYDRAIAVFGEDHELQARQVRTALSLLGADTDRIETVLHSWVNLPGGKGMSTRSGTGIDLDDLLDEAINRGRGAVQDRLETRTRGDLAEPEIDRIARQVGIGSVRYDIVSTQPAKSITFRWDEALDFEGQSAPYVQYAHARACGIIEGADGIEIDGEAAELASRLETPEAHALLRAIARFPAVIEAAAAAREPHRVATYIRELADEFNDFYGACPVLDAPDDLAPARLAVVVAARHALADGLGVLGIEAPERM